MTDLAALAFTSARVGICIVDAEGRLVLVNPAFCALLGETETALIGSRSEIAQAARAEGGIATRLGPGGAVDSEVKVRRNDGSEFWALVSGQPLDPGEPARGTVWVVRDMTPRKQLEESLRKTLSEREAILQTSMVGISFVRRRRRVWVNRTMADMVGYAPEEMIGHSIELLFADPAEHRRMDEEATRVLAEGRSYFGEHEFKRKDGREIWVQLTGRAIDLADPAQGVIFVVRDITDRKRAEEEMRRALERERELNELKTRFVAMTSHEFRTPLATILSSAELIELYEHRGAAPEARLNLLRDVKAATKRMAEMLDQVLLIGRADAGRLGFEPSALDLRELCRKILEEVRVTAGTAHDLRFACSGDCASVAVDERLVRHIVGNLLSNAVKYSPGGGAVSLDLAREGEAAVIAVADTGIGIPPADRARLFESFHRGQNVRNIPGTGLGLAIVKKAVDQHRGRIAVESEVGRGTRFTVTLPLTAPADGR